MKVPVFLAVICSVALLSTFSASSAEAQILKKVTKAATDAAGDAAADEVGNQVDRVVTEAVACTFDDPRCIEPLAEEGLLPGF